MQYFRYLSIFMRSVFYVHKYVCKVHVLLCTRYVCSWVYSCAYVCVCVCVSIFVHICVSVFLHIGLIKRSHEHINIHINIRMIGYAWLIACAIICGNYLMTSILANESSLRIDGGNGGPKILFQSMFSEHAQIYTKIITRRIQNFRVILFQSALFQNEIILKRNSLLIKNRSDWVFVGLWSKIHSVAVSFDKSGALRCGKINP